MRFILPCLLIASGAFSTPLTWHVEATATIDPAVGNSSQQASSHLYQRYLVTVTGGRGTDTLIFDAQANAVLGGDLGLGIEYSASGAILSPILLTPMYGPGWGGYIAGCQAALCLPEVSFTYGAPFVLTIEMQASAYIGVLGQPLPPEMVSVIGFADLTILPNGMNIEMTPIPETSSVVTAGAALSLLLTATIRRRSFRYRGRPRHH